LFWNKIKCLYTNKHYRPIYKKTNGNERDVINNNLSRRILPVYINCYHHKQHVNYNSRSSSPLKNFIRYTSAKQGSGYSSIFVCEVGPTRFFYRETLGFFQVGRSPVKHTISYKVNHDVGHSNQPKKLIIQYVFKEYFFGCKFLFKFLIVIFR